MKWKEIIKEKDKANEELAYMAIRWCATGHSNGHCLLTFYFKSEILFKFIKGEINYLEFKEKADEYNKELLDELKIRKDPNLALIHENIQAISYYLYAHYEYQKFVDSFKIFNLQNFIKLHEEIFDGNEDIKGNIRIFNISKKEEVLNGESAKYLDYYDIYKELNNFFNSIKEIKWNELSKEEKVIKFSDLLASLWIIHPFYEGNTRVTSLFMELLAFKEDIDIDFDILYQNPKEYRNSLVLYSLKDDDKFKDKSKLLDLVARAMN